MASSEGRRWRRRAVLVSETLAVGFLGLGSNVGKQGLVSVLDFRLHRRLLLHAGHTYIAKAR